jgi:hypothetical protein
MAARHRAEQIAGHLDRAAIFAGLGLAPRTVSAERWAAALGTAVGSRSREQVARSVELSLSD